MNPAHLFESYEISPCRLDDDKDITVTSPRLAEFWTLYGRRDNCAEAIGDFDTMADALSTYEGITGLSTTDLPVARFKCLPAR